MAAYIFQEQSQVVSTTLLHNSSGSLVGSLPLELTCDIFGLLPFPDRVRIALVCKAWRAVAINCAPLWADLEDIQVSALPDILVRTKKAPLRMVMTNVREDDANSLCTIVARHMNHMRYLDLRFRLDDDVDVCPVTLWSVLGCPAPLLEFLRLDINCERVPIDRLFSDHAPRLRIVRLDGFDLIGPSVATQSVTAFSARASWDAALFESGDSDLRSMSFVPHCNELFPALQQLRLTDLHDISDLTKLQFPMTLTALELGFEPDGFPRVGVNDHTFDLLSHANFTHMRALVLNTAPIGLPARVIAADDAVEWMLLQGPDLMDRWFDQFNANVRILTTSMRSRDFLFCKQHSLDQAILQYNVSSMLVDLVLGPNVLQMFTPQAIATMVCYATKLEVLTIVLPRRSWSVGTNYDVLSGGGWASQALSLKNLRELRVSAPPGLPEYPMPLDAGELWYFFETVVRMGIGRRVPSLSLFGLALQETRHKLKKCSGAWLEDRAEHVHYYDTDVMSMLLQGHIPVAREV